MGARVHARGRAVGALWRAKEGDEAVAGADEVANAFRV